MTTKFIYNESIPISESVYIYISEKTKEYKKSGILNEDDKFTDSDSFFIMSNIEPVMEMSTNRIRGILFNNETIKDFYIGDTNFIKVMEFLCGEELIESLFKNSSFVLKEKVKIDNEPLELIKLVMKYPQLQIPLEESRFKLFKNDLKEIIQYLETFTEDELLEIKDKAYLNFRGKPRTVMSYHVIFELLSYLDFKKYPKIHDSLKSDIFAFWTGNRFGDINGLFLKKDYKKDINYTILSTISQNVFNVLYNVNKKGYGELMSWYSIYNTNKAKPDYIFKYVKGFTKYFKFKKV